MAAVDTLRLRLIDTDASDALLTSLIRSAEAAVLARRYPYGYDPGSVELEPQYADLVIRVAVDMYNHMGAEGQKTHSENSIQRQWESGWVSESLLREVVPKAVVI